MSETFARAFPAKPTPLLSYGLSYPAALLQHVDNTFHSKRVYVISSASLARNTLHLDDLKQQLGGRLAGVRVGMRSHSLWSEVLGIVADEGIHTAHGPETAYTVGII
ncbi:hypothetical protein NUW58_g8376 [Xylaria curta]|uniref:Uncharacterized protein n=1 Tax=Xylaria curta TaxID=42375 RepID=A0ACC1N8W3_9PEZI|nr:hypothetical protein NUW58_g8376 [Xylaria curta]